MQDSTVTLGFHLGSPLTLASPPAHFPLPLHQPFTSPPVCPLPLPDSLPINPTPSSLLPLLPSTTSTCSFVIVKRLVAHARTFHPSCCCPNLRPLPHSNCSAHVASPTPKSPNSSPLPFPSPVRLHSSPLMHSNVRCRRHNHPTLRQSTQQSSGRRHITRPHSLCPPSIPFLPICRAHPSTLATAATAQPLAC